MTLERSVREGDGEFVAGCFAADQQRFGFWWRSWLELSLVVVAPVRVSAPAASPTAVARSDVVRDEQAHVLTIAPSWSLGGCPPDYQAVIPKLDADEPRTVGHLLRDRHDPPQSESRYPD